MGVEGLRANKKTVRTSARVVSLFAIFSIWISSSSVRAEIIGLPDFSCEKKKITMNPNQLQNENLLQSIMLSCFKKYFKYFVYTNSLFNWNSLQQITIKVNKILLSFKMRRIFKNLHHPVALPWITEKVSAAGLRTHAILWHQYR